MWTKNDKQIWKKKLLACKKQFHKFIEAYKMLGYHGPSGFLAKEGHKDDLILKLYFGMRNFTSGPWLPCFKTIENSIVIMGIVLV